jgi:hypothetical protein
MIKFKIERGATVIGTKTDNSDIDYLVFVSDDHRGFVGFNTLKFNTFLLSSMLWGYLRQDMFIWFVRDINIGKVIEDDGTLPKVKEFFNKIINIEILIANTLYLIERRPFETSRLKRIEHHLQLIFIVLNSVENKEITFELKKDQIEYLKSIKIKNELSTDDDTYIKNLYSKLQSLMPNYSQNKYSEMLNNLKIYENELIELLKE